MRLPAEPKFTETQIGLRVSELAMRINNDFEGQYPLCLITLKGALHFGSDLTRQISIPHEVDFIQVRSYENSETTGKIELICEPTISLQNRALILIEDIVDTGLTARFISDWSQKRGTQQFSICTLLDKPDNRKIELEADYMGFQVGKGEFVVGYGMDYNEQYRSLPDIFILETADKRDKIIVVHSNVLSLKYPLKS